MRMPWRDPAGRFSWFKTLVLAGLCLPILWLAFLAASGQLQPRPLTLVIHEVGLWALRFLLISLLVTPLRRILLWPRVLIVRRMLGVAVLLFALVHLCFYTADQSFQFGHIADELVLRYYLTIGLVALLFLIPLGLTSTDGMLKRLGVRRWRRLHLLVHPIALLALVHFFMQSKLDVTQPTFMAGCYVWLVLFRALDARAGKTGPFPLAWLVLLAPAAGLVTALGEALYYHLSVGAPLLAVLRANLSLVAGVRPAVLVTAAGLVLALMATLRRFVRPPARQATARSAPRAAA